MLFQGSLSVSAPPSCIPPLSVQVEKGHVDCRAEFCYPDGGYPPDIDRFVVGRGGYRGAGSEKAPHPILASLFVFIG